MSTVTELPVAITRMLADIPEALNKKLSAVVKRHHAAYTKRKYDYFIFKNDDGFHDTFRAKRGTDKWAAAADAQWECWHEWHDHLTGEERGHYGDKFPTFLHAIKYEFEEIVGDHSDEELDPDWDSCDLRDLIVGLHLIPYSDGAALTA